MTTAEALAAIPEIVAKAIPLKKYDNIKCLTQRRIAVENAEYRREQLAEKIKMLIIRHEPVGVGITIDIDELMRRQSDKNNY